MPWKLSSVTKGKREATKEYYLYFGHRFTVNLQMWKQIHQDLIYKQDDLGLLLFLLEKDALIPREFITEVILNIISPGILKTPIKKTTMSI